MFLLATTASIDPTALANQAINGVGGIVNAINWAAPTWDLFIVIFFIATVFLYGMSLGRDRIIIILISIYVALAMVSNAPYLGMSGSEAEIRLGNLFAFKVTAFLGLFVLLFFLLSRSALSKTFGDMANGSWAQVLVFSIFHVGLLVSVTLSFLPAEAANHLAPITRNIFATDLARFIWIVAPITGMAFLKEE